MVVGVVYSVGEVAFMYPRRTVGVVSVLVAAVLALSGVVFVPSTAAAVPAASTASGVAIVDPVAGVAAEDPDTLAATVAAVEPYLVVDAAGNLRLDVPVQVANGLDAQSFAALQHSVRVYNDLNAGVADSAWADASIPGLIWKFISKYWGSIVAIAKKSGKWAWYKAAQCASGAANALYKAYGNNLPGIAADIRAAIAIAGVGCVANL